MSFSTRNNPMSLPNSFSAMSLFYFESSARSCQVVSKGKKTTAQSMFENMVCKYGDGRSRMGKKLGIAV